MAIIYCYWHLVVKHGNFTLLLTSNSQQWQFHPFNTIRGQSDLFTVQCCHWHSKADIPPSQHYQRTEWSLYCSMLSLTLKGRYTPFIQHYQRREWSLYCSMLSLTRKGRYSLCSTLSEDRVISSLFNVVIETQRQIYLPPFNTIRGQSDLFTVQCCHWHSKADITPVQHYQRTEWSLYCLMLSLTLKSRYTPLVQHYQRTEWSLYCSMLSLTFKGRYTPPFNTIRGQSDLFIVQCCHWHSKEDIPPLHQHYQRTE